MFLEKTTSLSLLKELLKVNIPNMIMSFFNPMISIINVAYVGSLGDPHKVGGVGIGSVYFNVLGLSTILGMNGAITTFVS